MLLLFVLLHHIVLCWSSVTLAPPSVFSTLSVSSTLSSSANSISSSSLSASTTTSAQFPSLSGYSACVSNCLAVGISRVNCASVVDVNCFCVNPLFTSELSACVLANCPSELAAAENLAQQFCNVASSTPSLSFPPVPTTTTSDISSSSSVAPSSTVPATSSSTSSNSANWNTGVIDQGTVIGLVLSALGIVLGGYALP